MPNGGSFNETSRPLGRTSSTNVVDVQGNLVHKKNVSRGGRRFLMSEVPLWSKGPGLGRDLAARRQLLGLGGGGGRRGGPVANEIQPAKLGPLGFDVSQRRRTPRSAVARISRRAQFSEGGVAGGFRGLYDLSKVAKLVRKCDFIFLVRPAEYHPPLPTPPSNFARFGALVL